MAATAPTRAHDATGQSYSGLAIAALVLSFTCVLSWLGVVLGIVGIFRTGRGRAKGRWMAVTAIVVGLLLTALLVAIASFGVWIGKQFVTPENAEVGECADIERDGRNVGLLRTDCSGEHDAQIFAVHELTTREVAAIDSRRMGTLDVCIVEASENVGGNGRSRTLTVDGVDVRIDGVLEDPDNPSVGDVAVCFIEARSGTLDRSLVG